MENVTKFSCKIAPTNVELPLGFELWFNDQCVINIDAVTQAQDIEYNFSDDDGEHTLSLVLKNKQSNYTTVDSAGNIVSDSLLGISNLRFDEIETDLLWSTHGVYHHDFNGNAQAIEDTFHASMGCNGRVSLKFTTPIYLWLLEHI